MCLTHHTFCLLIPTASRAVIIQEFHPDLFLPHHHTSGQAGHDLNAAASGLFLALYIWEVVCWAVEQDMTSGLSGAALISRVFSCTCLLAAKKKGRPIPCCQQRCFATRWALCCHQCTNASEHICIVGTSLCMLSLPDLPALDLASSEANPDSVKKRSALFL